VVVIATTDADNSTSKQTVGEPARL
jgi:hypothetical protein